MLESFARFVTEHLGLCLAFGGIIFFCALGAGYLVGNNTLNSRVDDDIKKLIERLKYDGAIRSSIIDNVNLGVIAYDSTGLVYSNETLKEFPEFLAGADVLPQDINAFLDKYEKDNHLKSNYLLNAENDDSVIRANYVSQRKIYEIKILHRNVEGRRLDIIIVDDITQVKDDERRQKDLAANVSHELKTPLTVIRASEFFVNNITPENMPSYDDLIKWGNRIIANAVRMQDIVQDFLILSMCSQSVQMNIIDLGEVISKAVGNLTDYPNRDKVNIIVPDKMYYPLVFGNSNLLMRVVINLLTNAVKYIDYEGKTEPNEINISVVEIGERIGIQVSDNGRGIPEKDIDHLFERFFRVDNSGSRDVGGSGIGLSIAKDVADMHDGTINVTSAMNQGSTFTFVLPQAAGAFESIYDDAATGVVSEAPYYRTAAEFMAVQAVEAVRSMGYDDVEEKASVFEKTPFKDKTAHDKALAELIAAMGKERYTDLVDELTYIEPEFDDEDMEGFDDEEGFDEETEEIPASAPSVRQTPRLSEEFMKELDEERSSEEIDKEEARRILTQPILPRVVPQNEGSVLQSDDKSKESITIHPKTEKKLYNNNGAKSGKKKTKLFDLPGKESKSSPEVPSGEPEIQSAVRKVLDEATPLTPKQ